MKVGQLLLVIVLGLCGCNRPRYDTPEVAYQSYVRALSKNDSKTAYNALSQPTQKAIDARFSKIKEASKNTVKTDPDRAIFALALRPEEIKSIAVVGREADRAELEVTTSVRTLKQKMARENDGWKVNLSEEMSIQ